MKSLPSQEINFDPAAWVGFSVEQVELIRKGFMAGLDQAAKKAAEDAAQSRLGELDARCAEADYTGWTPADEESMRFVRDTPRFNEAGEWMA